MEILKRRIVLVRRKSADRLESMEMGHLCRVDLDGCCAHYPPMCAVSL